MAGSRPRKPVAPMMFPSQLARQGPGMQPDAGQPVAVGGMEISVRRKENPEQPRLFVFRQPRVTVGRSSACDLRLDDPERLSSSRHAEIVLTGDRVQVIDLGSRNFTFLNGDKIEPQTEYDVGPEDEIVISNSELRARVIDVAAGVEDDRTVMAEASINPFAEDARLLAEVLGRIAVKFEDEAPERRQAALEEALKAALGGETAEAHAQVARLLSDPTGSAE